MKEAQNNRNEDSLLPYDGHLNKQYSDEKKEMREKNGFKEKMRRVFKH